MQFLSKKQNSPLQTLRYSVQAGKGIPESRVAKGAIWLLRLLGTIRPEL